MFCFCLKTDSSKVNPSPEKEDKRKKLAKQVEHDIPFETENHGNPVDVLNNIHSDSMINEFLDNKPRILMMDGVTRYLGWNRIVKLFANGIPLRIISRPSGSNHISFQYFHDPSCFLSYSGDVSSKDLRFIYNPKKILMSTFEMTLKNKEEDNETKIFQFRCLHFKRQHHYITCSGSNLILTPVEYNITSFTLIQTNSQHGTEKVSKSKNRAKTPNNTFANLFRNTEDKTDEGQERIRLPSFGVAKTRISNYFFGKNSYLSAKGLLTQRYQSASLLLKDDDSYQDNKFCLIQLSPQLGKFLCYKEIKENTKCKFELKGNILNFQNSTKWKLHSDLYFKDTIVLEAVNKKHVCTGLFLVSIDINNKHYVEIQFKPKILLNTQHEINEWTERASWKLRRDKTTQIEILNLANDMNNKN